LGSPNCVCATPLVMTSLAVRPPLSSTMPVTRGAMWRPVGVVMRSVSPMLVDCWSA
jgi:hypothetical protein